MEKMTGYCVTCGRKSGVKSREMKDVKITKSKNGRRMAKGVCVKCGTKMNKFLPNA